MPWSPLAKRHVVVIAMLTTALHPGDLARAQELPIAGFLNEPLTKEKFHARLRERFAPPPPHCLAGPPQWRPGRYWLH